MIFRGRAPARFGAAVVALLLPAVAPASVNRVQLAAHLTPGQEAPPQQHRNVAASGTFTATVRPVKNGYRLTWRLTFTKLSGAATSAYIHRGRAGTHSAAIVQLCSPCRSGASGNEYFSPPELTLARQARLYVNVRTPLNPGGEIRGQVRVS